MTRNMVNNSIPENKLDIQNMVCARHVIFYKCNALFTAGINGFLANRANYSTKRCDSQKDLEHQVSQIENSIVVVQLGASGALDLQLKAFIAHNSQLKFLLVFQENRVPFAYEFLHREGVELYFMRSSRSKLISAIESLEKGFSSVLNIKPIVFEVSMPLKEVKDEEPRINPFDKLTQIQSKVAQQLCQGIQQKIIAANMGLAPSSITIYKKNVLRKLKISSVAELAVLNNKHNAIYQV